MRRLRWLVVMVVSGWWLGVAGPARCADTVHDLSIVDSELPPQLETAESISVPVTVANRGTAAWSSGDGFFLSYHWFDTGGRKVVWDGQRSRLPGAVSPGDRTEVIARVVAPSAPGDYLLQWDVVHEGVLWVSEVDPTPGRSLAVSVGASHAFSVVDSTLPRWMTAGGRRMAIVLLRNDGPRPWRGDGSFALSYRWFDRSGQVLPARGHRVPSEGRRVRVGDAVAPGEAVRLAIEIEAPPAGGFCRLRLDMVEEKVCWFSERGGAGVPAASVVVVSDPLADPRWWAVGCLLAAAASAAFLWRPRSGVAVPLVSGADGGWCAGALVIKQSVVLHEAGAGVSPRGWIMIIASAVAVAAATTALPSWFRGWSRWSVVAAATLVLWADVVYLRFFGDLPAAAAVAAVGQAGAVAASIRSLLSMADLWLWLDLLPGAVLVLVAGRLRRGRPARRRGSLALAVATVVVSVAVITVLSPRGLFEQIFRRVWLAREVGVLNLHAAEGARSAWGRWHREQLDDHRRAEIEAWFASRAAARSATGPLAAAAAGMNLVMIQVESLQGFVVGLEIGGREVTPFLNRWRDEAIWFSNLTDQSLAGRSSDSELATQVSLLPSSEHAAAFEHAGNTFTGIADVLAGAGYRTVSAVPYEGSFWNRRITHPAYGFRQSLFDTDFAAGENIGWGLNDRDFLQQMAVRMTRWPRPFAAYLLTLSLHHPFEGFPRQHRSLDVGRWQGRPFGEFLHTMYFFDRALESFVAELERSRLAATTVVAVWGDHDAGFEWSQEVAAAMGADSDGAGWYLSQEVPLFIRLPGDGGRPAGERTEPGGHVDVAPTLLALLGIDPADYGFVGRNLLSGVPDDQPVVGEYGCWRDERHLYLQGDGTLTGGRCLELPRLREVGAEACADGFARASRQTEVSRSVLEHDLQRWLHGRLAGGAR